MENTSKVTTTINEAERQITMTRVFNAPRELLFRVLTDPLLVPDW